MSDHETPKGLYDPVAIANRFVRIARGQGDRTLDILKLMKMVFFAHGFATLIPLSKPLVQGGFQAWQYGPVAPRAYRIFRSHANGIFVEKPIEDPSIRLEEKRMEGDGQVMRLHEGVYTRYRRMDPFKLSFETHGEDSPWSRARGRSPSGYDAEILNSDIREHFASNHLLSEVYGGEVKPRV